MKKNANLLATEDQIHTMKKYSIQLYCESKEITKITIAIKEQSITSRDREP